jgi:glycosyltransferase involved in cell wall biosynthesis
VTTEVVLFSIAELGSGAHEAHFRALARRASASGVTVHEVALVSWRTYATARGRAEIRRQRESARTDLSGRLIVLPHEPRFATLRWSEHALARSVRSLCRGARPVVHCRGHLAGYVAVMARRRGLDAAILHDVRGDRAAEVRAFGGEAPPEVIAEREAVACREADANACVSTALRERLRELHGIDADVFPCAADTDRFRPDEDARGDLRARLGAGDRFLLGYLGSAAGWQRPDAALALFRRVQELRPGALLLVLTPDVPAWLRLLDEAGVASDSPERLHPGAPVHVRRVPHAEMPAWTAALDATVLLREHDAVNRVASPIKFGESLACGVPVLATQGIGDASSLVARHGLGAVFDDLLLCGADDPARLAAFVDRQSRERKELARACRDAAERSWSWHEQLPRWLALYDRLADAGTERAASGGVS